MTNEYNIINITTNERGGRGNTETLRDLPDNVTIASKK